MAQMPSEVEDAEVPWIWCRPSEEEDYFDEHGVKKTEEVDSGDIPDSDNDKVRALDKEALEEEDLTGKWNVFVEPAKVDSLWEEISRLVSENKIWQSKVSTKAGRKRKGNEVHVLIIYTPNYFDQDDVFRVRDILRNECDIEETLYYKPDIYTKKGIYSSTAEQLGLPGASRYYD